MNQKGPTSWADICARSHSKTTSVPVNNNKSYLSLNFATPVLSSQRQSNIVPLNKVVIPSPVQKVASRTNMVEYKKTLSKGVDVGTQTTITLNDTLVIVPKDGDRRSETNEEFSSLLLANASVTAMTNNDEFENTKTSSGISEYISQSRPNTRSYPTSISSSFHSVTKNSTNYLMGPPPGLENVFNINQDDESDNDIQNTAPIPKPKYNKAFSIWNGPSIGLGETILEYIKTGKYKK